MVCFVVGYHKGYYAQDRLKTICRFVLRKVGKLIVWYLWLVLLFWEDPFYDSPPAGGRNVDTDSSEGEEGGPKERHRVGRHTMWNGEKLWRVLKEITGQLLGSEITIAAWRERGSSLGPGWARGGSSRRRSRPGRDESSGSGG